ncbi:TIGR04326 family surface carbohydrate biosynthesis protein [Chloroflexota bacterium]
MPCLLVFDDNISDEDINSLSLGEEDSMILFPLTSKQNLLNQVMSRCHAEGIKDVKVIETGHIIDEMADGIRDKYIEFIAGLPDKFRIQGKTIKEWFYYPDGGISLWWLSLVAEKNPFKSDSFNRLVQLYSMIGVIEEHKVKRIILSCSSRKLESALGLYCKENSAPFMLLPSRQERGIRKLLDKYPALMAFIGACVYLSNEFVRWINIKSSVRYRLKKRIDTKINNPILVVTYYPNIDTGLAGNGIFKNMYYLPLQEEWEKQGREIIWVAMYVHNNSISFAEGLRYARQFITDGYRFVFINEFLTATSFAKIFIGLLWSLIRFKKIERELPDYHYFNENVSVYSIFREDWYQSFCGVINVQGFLYLEAFKNMFKKLGGIRKGVYYCEMHAWEKALLAAKKRYAAEMELFGYQHSTVSRMLLNHFNHPSELQKSNSKYSMPKPDKIACDGEISRNYFRESGWREDELTVVEAIRYGHLRDITPHERKLKDNVILVVLSINVEESIAILNMAYEGLKEATNIKVWLKPHPFLAIDLVLKKSGISLSDVQFEIKKGQIEKLLPDVNGLIIGESTVALEALAYGCRIITLNLPDMVNMSPLRGIQSNLVKYVGSAAQLQKVANELIKESEEDNSREVKELINQFFYFNKASAKPEKFLELLS